MPKGRDTLDGFPRPWCPILNTRGSRRIHSSALAVVLAFVSLLGCSAGPTGDGEPPPAQPWPNEPAGFTVLTDQPWDALASLGWKHVNRSSQSRIVQDPTAPLSPHNVLEDFYPAGYVGGGEPAVDFFRLGSTELFIGFWWKASPNWQGHPSDNTNKLAFVWTQQGTDWIIAMWGNPGGPYDLRTLNEGMGIDEWLTPNRGNGQVVPGTWYRIEWYVRLATEPGANNGMSRWWINGQLVGDYANINTSRATQIVQFEFAPTWGGLAGVKQHDDYFRYDNAHLSVP